MPHMLHDYSFSREFEITRALSLCSTCGTLSQQFCSSFAREFEITRALSLLLAVFFTTAVVSLIIPESDLFAVFVKLLKNDTCFHG